LTKITVSAREGAGPWKRKNAKAREGEGEGEGEQGEEASGYYYCWTAQHALRRVREERRKSKGDEVKTKLSG
jgi:hypothetical protein